MQDIKVTISYLTTVLRIPGNVCKLDVFFIIQTLAPLGLQSVVLTVKHIYIYINITYATYRRAYKHVNSKLSGMLLLQYC